MSQEKLKTASVLAFERKLDPSDALFAAGKWENRTDDKNWKPIGVNEKSIRGTISNRLKTKGLDPAKLDADIQKPNLQKVDVAMLPNDMDTLRVSFTLRVLGGAGTPSACNNMAYQQQLQTIINSYKESQGFATLAERYAYNLANGRFLWRNRIGAEQVEVKVRQLKNGKVEKEWIFQALDFSLRSFDIPAKVNADLQAMANAIKNGLEEKEYVLLEVVAYVRMGNGQEVFPSQELVLDKNEEKSKTLYSIENANAYKVAGMHSQKIGNALRTIDTWYPKEEQEEYDVGPISIEPYGSVTSLGKAFRKPQQKVDFYNLLDNWVLNDKIPDVSQQHFVIANLIRGGVFGASEKE